MKIFNYITLTGQPSIIYNTLVLLGHDPIVSVTSNELSIEVFELDQSQFLNILENFNPFSYTWGYTSLGYEVLFIFRD